MNLKNLFSTSVFFSLCFCLNAQYNASNLKIMSNDIDNKEGAPDNFNVNFTYKHLRLYPIIANDQFIKQHDDIGKFTLLKDAIEKKKILISETGAGSRQEDETNNRVQLNNVGRGVSGTVNTLIAENVSSDTIFIMAGEVVKGGKQDRVIGKDVVIPPGKKIELSAFCVEQNRWSTKGKNKGSFDGYFNVTSMDIRKSVTEEKDQSKVWKKVAKHTSKNGASSSTSTYTNLENSSKYQKDVKKYMEKFSSAFNDKKTVIGLIAVTGNEVIGCDMFATHELFISSYKNLIHSYIGYSITNGSEIQISNSEVFSYLNNILKNENKQDEKIEKNGTLYKWKNKKLHITTY